MSKIDELRNNKSNQINLVDLGTKLLKNNDVKYVNMFVNVIKKAIDENIDSDTTFTTISPDAGFTSLEKSFMNGICLLHFMEPNTLRYINYFCEKHKENAIKGFDVQNTTLSEVVSKAKEIRKRELEKLEESSIKTIFEDDEWFILLPLTYQSSLKYGANTKWCTASKETRTHFDSYTKDGILIYIINKKNDKKTAFYHDMCNYDVNRSSLSTWNEKDEFVEFIYHDLPDHVKKVIIDYTKHNSTSNDVLRKQYAHNSNNSSFVDPIVSTEEFQIIEYARAGQALHAVKAIKEYKGIGLREAKDLYDNHYKPMYYNKAEF